MMLDRLLIALRIKRAQRLAKPKPLPAYLGPISPRPRPAPAPWRRSFDAPASDAPPPMAQGEKK
jgi:hypothetical protein